MSIKEVYDFWTSLELVIISVMTIITCIYVLVKCCLNYWKDRRNATMNFYNPQIIEE